MKKLFILLGFITIVASAYSKNLQAYLSHAAFFSPKDGPYIETYLSVVGRTVHFISDANNKFQATVEISMVFRQNDIVKGFKKIDLNSPEIDDTCNINFTFMDQQRFQLPNGDYKMEIQIVDKNRPKAIPFKTSDSISINFPSGKINISGIQLVESYKTSVSSTAISKNGYDLVPFTINFYPQTINNLTFYAEVYNTDKLFKPEEKFLVNYYIESVETNKVISDYFKFKKEAPKSVIVEFNEFDISNLPSGNYYLVVEVKDKDNNSVAINKLFFQRSNPSVHFKAVDLATLDVRNTFAGMITNIDTLRDYIKSTYPISTQSEKLFAENSLKSSDIVLLQQYFLNFWTTRNEKDPAKSWATYYIEVLKVNHAYKTMIKKGYETDRGRVYLQYGPPNGITAVTSDPSALPYEIWQYYTLKNQRNKKFVFYEPDLVTNDYELIHSDAEGEVNNPAWQMLLNGRNNSTNNPDQNTTPGYYGGRANDYYNNPH
jgi:GWxTD domain-containing protein